MSTRQQAAALADLYDAAKIPAQWPAALQGVASAVGGIGAGQVVCNKRTGGVEWVTITGPCAALEPRYISHYAPLDLYAPVLQARPARRWLPLSRTLPDGGVAGNEWYNDFILKSGVADILAAKMYEDQDTTVLLGIHRGPASDRAVAQFNAGVRALLQPLVRATRLHVAFRRMGRALAAAHQALSYLSLGVVLTDVEGHVLESNPLAAEILQREDGLQIRDGRLAATRTFDSARLAASIAGRAPCRSTPDGHLLIGRKGGARPHAVTIAPLDGGGDGARAQRIMMVLIVNPDWQTPSERSVAAFFGLSPAESRLAASLMQGHKLADIARDSGVEVSTLRTQLSSILRKVGVERQVDLVRVLSSIGPTGPHRA
jgi:DNA-binding CsgD family transcriptional regulator/PAS domain-containing protein